MPELNLSLPENQPPKPKKKLGTILLLLLVLALGCANLVITLQQRQGNKTITCKTGLNSEKQKDFALKLENQGLTEPAARAWKNYLSKTNLDKSGQAKIYYRLGKIYQQGSQNSQALEQYYYAESLADVPELRDDISKRTRECLEDMGKLAALHRDLAERVDLDKNKTKAANIVVAEIGNDKITLAQLENSIEAEIERQTAQLANYLPAEQLQQQKERLFKSYSSNEARLRFLNQLVYEELLFREARTRKLSNKDIVKALLRDAKRKILASQVMDEELSKISITSSDIKNYFAAHKEKYTVSERIKISMITLANEKDALAALKKLKKGADFAKLAAKISINAKERKQKGVINTWISRGSSIPGIEYKKEDEKAIFSLAKGKFTLKPLKSEKGFHLVKLAQREGQRQRPFAEVEREVYGALRRQKIQEIQEEFSKKLREKYNAIFHFSALSQASPKKEPTSNQGVKKLP